MDAIVDAIPELSQSLILDVPFSSADVHYEPAELPGITIAQVEAAAAIRYTDGVIVARPMMNTELFQIITDVFDNGGVIATFGTVYYTDVMESYELEVFGDIDRRVFVKHYTY